MATRKRSTRRLSTQASHSATSVLLMPQIPIYPALARQATGLTDAELSTLCGAYRSDGTDPAKCLGFQRRTLANLERRSLVMFNEVAEVWRVTTVGARIVTTLCNSDTQFPVASSRTARVLQFPMASQGQEARR